MFKILKGKPSKHILLIIGVAITFIILIYYANRTYNIKFIERENIALESFSNKLYPNFYTEFGGFPTSYLNTCYDNPSNPGGKIMDLTLKDFHIASAYRPYQPAGETYDICSYQAIKEVIDKGARFHFIDIWSSNPINKFDNTAYPIVRNETLLMKYGKALDFDKVCEIYKKHSWTGTKYPLILYLNLHNTASDNRFVLNKIARILWNNFKGRFTGVEYAFARQNIGDIPIREAMGNVIILTNVYPEEGQLQELVNGVISEKIQNDGRLTIYTNRNLRYGGIGATNSNLQSIINFNKTNLGILIPETIRNVTNILRPGIDTLPISGGKTNGKIEIKDQFEPMTTFGFQNVCINYQKPGKERDQYINFFKKSSLILKSDDLRYIPCPKPVIKKQNIKASYAPRSINFENGYFEHSF